MKTLTMGLLLLGLATSTFAASKADLDNRVRSLTAKFEALQQKPEARVPADLLKKAQGVVLLDRTKAGFIFAFQGGGGIALVREGKGDKWGPAAFFNATEASVGLQIGGQQSFIVILLMNTNATHRLTESAFEFSGEARGTAGDASAGQEGKFSGQSDAMLVYVDRKGLYGGAAIKGGNLAPDGEANRVYYGQFVTAKDILFDKKVKPGDSMTELGKKLNEHSKETKK
ncbi:MAG: lipid-binding SYLF domain-containing protein [Limisphaerales bacterium]